MALDAGVEVAAPREQRAGRRRLVVAELDDAARDPGLAVGDVVEEAAGEVGVAVAVHVAVGRGRALGDRLLVGEVVVVVEVDVDRVVDAGLLAVDDQERGALAVGAEQVVVGVAADHDLAGLRPRAREAVGVVVDAVGGVEVARRAGAGAEAQRARAARVQARAADRRGRRVPGQAAGDLLGREQDLQRAVRVERLRPAVPAVVGGVGVLGALPGLPGARSGPDARSRCRRRARRRSSPCRHSRRSRRR